MSTEDEVDLRPYFVAILQHKWLILLIGVFFAVIALSISLLQPRKYNAQAALLLTRSRAQLSLANQFTTVNEPIDARSRMDALIAIASSDALAYQTWRELNGILAGKIVTVEDFKKMIEITNKGDSIIISAITLDPELSAIIANTVADQLAQTINLAYSGEQPLSDIQERLISAKQEYEKAQTELEYFIRENPKSSLEIQLVEVNKLVDILGSDRTVKLANFSQFKHGMERLRQQAEALKSQIERGNESAAGDQGDALAVLWARMNAINESTSVTDISSSSNPQIQQQNPIFNIQISDVSSLGDISSNYSADIDALIRLADQEIVKADENIRTLSEEINRTDGSEDSEIILTTKRIQELEQLIENSNAQEKQLTSRRDLAWQAYQAIVQKEAELKNATMTNNQVTLASEAIVPDRPESRGTVRNTLIAGVLGIMIGVLWAVGSKWWKESNQPTSSVKTD